MSDIITGIVAIEPRHIATSAGPDISSFWLASSWRRFDTDTAASSVSP